MKIAQLHVPSFKIWLSQDLGCLGEGNGPPMHVHIRPQQWFVPGPEARDVTGTSELNLL